MSGTLASPVVIGFGNPLRGDDGVGLRVIDELRSLAAREPASLPPGTCLVAAGSPTLDLLGIIRDAPALLLIDAVDDGRTPGSLEVLRGDRVDATVGRGSIGDLLVAGRLTGRLPGSISMIGVQVAATEVGLGLSAAVEDAVPAAVRLSQLELTRLAAPTASSANGGPRRAAHPDWRAPQPAGGVYA